MESDTLFTSIGKRQSQSSCSENRKNYCRIQTQWFRRSRTPCSLYSSTLPPLPPDLLHRRINATNLLDRLRSDLFSCFLRARLLEKHSETDVSRSGDLPPHLLSFGNRNRLDRAQPSLKNDIHRLLRSGLWGILIRLNSRETRQRRVHARIHERRQTSELH